MVMKEAIRQMREVVGRLEERVLELVGEALARAFGTGEDRVTRPPRQEKIETKIRRILTEVIRLFTVRYR